MKKLSLVALLSLFLLVGGCSGQEQKADRSSSSQQKSIPREVTLQYQASPASLAIVEVPAQGMIKYNSFTVNDADGRKVTLELWAGSEAKQKGGPLLGYLIDGTQTFNLGVVGPCIPTNKYEVKTQDINRDGSKELIVTVDGGQSIVETSVFSFDAEQEAWTKDISAPLLKFIDFDGDGKDEIVGVSRGYEPEKMWLFKENNKLWEKSDVAASAKQYFAKLVENRDQTMVVMGKDPAKPFQYTFKDGKLILVE